MASRRSLGAPEKNSPYISDLPQQILHVLEAYYPNASTELIFSDPYELLVATILSAQSTDKRVNRITPALFKQYPNSHTLATANEAQLQSLIRSTGCFRIKSRSLLRMARVLVKDYDGDVPTTMDTLIKLPGVGRKTANVLLGHAFNAPGFPVDRHVLRVSNRLELIHTTDPTTAEFQLKMIFPKTTWLHASDVLIQHGRNLCKTRPRCDNCAARELCNYHVPQPPQAVTEKSRP